MVSLECLYCRIPICIDIWSLGKQICEYSISVFPILMFFRIINIYIIHKGNEKK